MQSAVRDRISLSEWMVVACFIGLFAFDSQSAASYPCYALSILMLVYTREWNDVFKDWLVLLIFLLITYLSLSALWSLPFEARSMLTYGVRGALVFLFVVAFAECQMRNRLRSRLSGVLAGVGGVVAFLAVVRFFLDPPDDGRLAGFGQLDSPVVAALVYAAVAVMAVSEVGKRPGLMFRFAYLTAALVLTLAVYYSDSRGALGGLLCGLSVYLLARWSPSVREFVSTVLLLALVAAASILALSSDDGFRSVLFPRGDSFRIEIWNTTLDRVFSESAVFGMGIATDDDVVVGGLRFLHPHSLYISVLYQGGLLAFALFVAMVLFVVRTLLVHFAHQDAKLALGLLGLALSAYFLDGHELVDKISDTWVLFWLPVSIAVGLRWQHSLSGEPAT